MLDSPLLTWNVGCLKGIFYPGMGHKYLFFQSPHAAPWRSGHTTWDSDHLLPCRGHPCHPRPRRRHRRPHHDGRPPWDGLHQLLVRNLPKMKRPKKLLGIREYKIAKKGDCMATELISKCVQRKSCLLHYACYCLHGCRHQNLASSKSFTFFSGIGLAAYLRFEMWFSLWIMYSLWKSTSLKCCSLCNMHIHKTVLAHSQTTCKLCWPVQAHSRVSNGSDSVL